MCNLVSKCQYVHEHARFLRSAIFIFSPGKADNPGRLLALAGIFFYANFFTKLNPQAGYKINKIQSIKKLLLQKESTPWVIHSPFFWHYQSERI